MDMSRIYCLILIFFMSFGFTAKAQDSRSAAIGDVIVFALPAATIATTLIIGDTQGTWQFAKGLILTEGITFGLKALIDKNRPDNSDQNSFPSGHASSTFHSASFICVSSGGSSPDSIRENMLNNIPERIRSKINSR